MRNRVSILFIVALIAVSCRTPSSGRNSPPRTPAVNATAALQKPALLPTATLPPSPTPPPSVRIELAEKALFEGNYERARLEFQNVLYSSDDPEIQAAAAMGIGRALYLMRNYPTAIEALTTMIGAYPHSSVLANAYYFLARSLEAQSQYAQAAEAYTRFLELRPGVLDAYMQNLRGDAFLAAGNPGAAVEAFTASISATTDSSAIWTELKLGRAYAAMGDYTNAIRTYLHVYENTSNEYARAQANLLMGQAYMAMGETEQAHTRFLDSVANFPKAFDTHSGLVQLVNDGVPVDELSRGIVNYYAGQYGLAIAAFDRYINAGSAQNATAYHYRALSRLAMNEPGPAIEDWDYIIENFPTDPLWPAAFEEKAYALWAYLDRNEEAANLLLEYVYQAPESAQAPGFLYDAARILERNNQLIEAAGVWEQVMERYPSYERSFQSLFLAGISYYRAGDFAKALTVFQRCVVLANLPEEQAQAYLWIGKTQQATGNTAAARTAWEQAAQRDPTGYYSERAKELLQGREPFVVQRPVNLDYDLEQERELAEQWLRQTFSLPPETNLNGLGELASDPRIVRGSAFWDLGLYDEARSEYEAVRKEVAGDPVQTYRLMNAMLDLGMYRSAILASRQILDLANLDDAGTLHAPAYFNHIRFGVYFKDQVLAASQAEGFHPLFLLAVIRQESLFEGFAVSGAGARGLMQIMPATGQEIASQMNWPENYESVDLYRAEVSIRLGARYLARQHSYFGGNIYATLAAYNGGPGNTSYWVALAGDDPDLLLEVIRAEETRRYITQIFEFFQIYRLLYENEL